MCLNEECIGLTSLMLICWRPFPETYLEIWRVIHVPWIYFIWKKTWVPQACLWRKKLIIMLPLPTQYLYNGFQFSKWFHRHYLILEAMWCSRKKTRLESGNLNCSLVSPTRCRWPWMRYLTCLGRSLLICNMPVLEQIISRSFQFQNSIIL